MVIKNLNSSEVLNSDIHARIEFNDVIDYHDNGKHSSLKIFWFEIGIS